MSVLHQTVSREGYLHQKVSNYVKSLFNATHFMVFRIRWEPTSFNPSVLREQFVDAPKTGKGNDTDDGGKNQISDKY